jgi:hypothetical protein
LSKADEPLSAMGSHLLPFDTGQLELVMTRLRAQVPAAAWTEAWAAGRRLSLDDAVRLAANALGPAALQKGE